MYIVTVNVGDKYSNYYSTALRKQVKDHLQEDLIVLGEDIEQKHPYKGWWSKMELFSPLFKYRPCLFFDLDTYIIDDCRDLLIDTQDLWLIRDFNCPERSNSGVMIIPENTTKIWENHFRWHDQTDGDFLTTQPHKVLQDHFDGIKSYKKHCRQTPSGRIICFHGKPKPHETEGWAIDYWNKILHSS